MPMIFYVDTINGSDLGDGSGWGFAWKTTQPLKTLFIGLTEAVDVEVRFAKTPSTTNNFQLGTTGVVSNHAAGKIVGLEGTAFDSPTMASGFSGRVAFYATAAPRNLSALNFVEVYSNAVVNSSGLPLTLVERALLTLELWLCTDNAGLSPAVAYSTLANDLSTNLNPQRFPRRYGQWDIPLPDNINSIAWYGTNNNGFTVRLDTTLVIATTDVTTTGYIGWKAVYVPDGVAPRAPAMLDYASAGVGTVSFCADPVYYPVNSNWTCYPYFDVRPSLSVFPASVVTIGTPALPFKFIGGYNTGTGFVDGKTCLDSSQLEVGHSLVTNTCIWLKNLVIANPGRLLTSSPQTTGSILGLTHTSLILRDWVVDHVYIPRYLKSTGITYSTDNYLPATLVGNGVVDAENIVVSNSMCANHWMFDVRPATGTPISYTNCVNGGYGIVQYDYVDARVTYNGGLVLRPHGLDVIPHGSTFTGTWFWSAYSGSSTFATTHGGTYSGCYHVGDGSLPAGSNTHVGSRFLHYPGTGTLKVLAGGPANSTVADMDGATFSGGSRYAVPFAFVSAASVFGQWSGSMTFTNFLVSLNCGAMSTGNAGGSLTINNCVFETNDTSLAQGCWTLTDATNGSTGDIILVKNATFYGGFKNAFIGSAGITSLSNVHADNVTTVAVLTGVGGAGLFSDLTSARLENITGNNATKVTYGTGLVNHITNGLPKLVNSFYSLEQDLVVKESGVNSWKYTLVSNVGNRIICETLVGSFTVFAARVFTATIRVRKTTGTRGWFHLRALWTKTANYDDIVQVQSVNNLTWETLTITYTPDVEGAVELYISATGLATGNVWFDKLTVAQP